MPDANSADARIAVIMPCRNAGLWIAEALDSVAHQSRPPDEIVVVDDGSSDNSVATTERWIERHTGTPPVRVIRQSALGVAAAVRHGVASTSANLIVRVDADDLLDPEFLAALEAALADRPEAGYAYSAMRMFGSATGRYPVQEFDATQLVIGGNFVPASALMRRAAYEAAGGIADLPAWEDWDLWLSFLEAGWEGVLVDRELYYWRRHESSRNTMSWSRRRRLRLRIWWRHRTLVSRYIVRGIPVAARRIRHPVRQQ